MDNQINRKAAHHYYQNLFPASNVYAWYTPPVFTKDITDNAYFTEISLPALATTRDWAVGGENCRRLFNSGKELQEALCAVCLDDPNYYSVRCDVGPVYALTPAEVCLTRHVKKHKPIYQTELRFDIDATDAPYKEHRTICGCGDDKTKFCACCALLVGAVAQYVDTCVRKYIMPVNDLHWSATGGRGVHGWSRDARWARMNQNMRHDLCTFIQSSECVRAFGDMLRIAEARLGHLAIPVALDAPVTFRPTHLLRCLFSIHDRTGRVNVPLAAPSDLTATSSPSIEGIEQNPAWHKALHVFENQWNVATTVVNDSM